MEKKLSAGLADRLLDLLSEDDAFRDRFGRDPRAALAELGLKEAADPGLGAQDGPWACLHGAGLPSKEQVRLTRDSLRDQMTSLTGMANMIFMADR